LLSFDILSFFHDIYEFLREYKKQLTRVNIVSASDLGS